MAEPGHWGLIAQDGAVLYVEDFVASDVVDHLSDPESFIAVAASEPYPAMASEAEAVEAVFVLPDGTGIQAGVAATVDGFVLDESVNNQFEVEAREGPKFAYSRMHGAVFVIGGQIDEEFAGEIWILGLDGSTLELSTGEYQPQYVHDAVVAGDGMLWVLDAPSESSDDRRLVRIDVAEPRVQVVWSGTRISSYLASALRADRDGSVLLFSASATGYCSTRIRGEPWLLGTETPVLQRTDSGALYGVPTVHPAGYQFVLQAGSVLSRVNVAELVDQSGGTARIEDCL